MTSAYKAACNAAGSRVIVQADEAFSKGFTELLLGGHRVVELSDKRLVDIDCATLAVALAETKQFTVVDLSYNELGAGAIESIADLLKVDTTMQVLDLSQNAISAEVIEVLCTALKESTTLRVLRLDGNALGGTGGMAVAEMLQANSALQHLSLSNCGLTTESLVALATVLRDNSSLLSLDVSRPLAQTIMDEPAAHFARMLKVNTALEELDLSKVGLRDFGLRLILEELCRAPDSALHTLRVRCNKIELCDDVIQPLAALLLAPGCRLTTLDLAANHLCDEGALKLAEVVSGNVSLRALDVGANGLLSRGLCGLARAARTHPKLRSIHLWGNGFDSAACLAWLEVLASVGNSGYGGEDPYELDFTVQEVDNVYHCVENK